MGPGALLLIGVVGWLLWTGKLQRMTAKDGLALGLALLGAIMVVKGRPVIGIIPILAAAGYAAWRKPRMQDRNRAQATRPAAKDSDVADARALLGLSANADAEGVRAAHRRLIATVHPDKGGTQALAAKINAARDLLLRHDETKA